VQGSMTVWEPGKKPLPAKPRGKMGRPPRLLQRTPEHQPVSLQQLAMALPSASFRNIAWREGVDRKLRSRFAAVRIRPAHRDEEKAEPHAEEWLLIEWPQAETEPTQYWLSSATAAQHCTQSSGQNGEAALDHRTRLPGIETRVGARALRRP
jgi:SRSO17 transposase